MPAAGAHSTVCSLLFLVASFLLPLRASADVFISRTFSTDVFRQQVDIPAGNYWFLPLGPSSAGDTFDVALDLGNGVYRDVTAFVADDIGLGQFRSRQPFQAQGKQKAMAPFTFRAVARTAAPHYLVVDNTYARLIQKKAVVAVRKTTTLPDAATDTLKSGLQQVYAGLEKAFEFPSFNIRVRPCGQVNAFSAGRTGDITLCSELISAFASKPGVLVGTLFHELGHTLSNLWGLPGAQNEDMADEFAVAFLLKSVDGRRLIEEWLTFFESRNSWQEAQHAIVKGDSHSLSVQRIRNIRMHVARASDLERRWNRYLYPHMTAQSLQQVVARPSASDDVEMALRELAARGAM